MMVMRLAKISNTSRHEGPFMFVSRMIWNFFKMVINHFFNHEKEIIQTLLTFKTDGSFPCQSPLSVFIISASRDTKKRVKGPLLLHSWPTFFFIDLPFVFIPLEFSTEASSKYLIWHLNQINSFLNLAILLTQEDILIYIFYMILYRVNIN